MHLALPHTFKHCNRSFTDNRAVFMKILFLASGAFAVPTLRSLVAGGSHQIAVITQPDKPGGRGRHLTSTPVAEAAMQLNLPVVKTDSANGLLPHLPVDQPDLHVVIAFGQKLSDKFVASARLGAINLHGSLLPRFRGAAPIQWSILSGDTHAGVSVIRISSVMDGGAILARRATPIGTSETSGELHDRLAQLGVEAVTETIRQLAIGLATPEPQDESQATRAPKLDKSMSWVDFTKPSHHVSCRIRGLSPWPGCRATLRRAQGGQPVELRLIKAIACGDETRQDTPGVFLNPTDVACGTGTVRILTVQPSNRAVMSMMSFVNGHAITAGDTLVSEPPPLE